MWIETQRFKERGMGLVASGKLPEAEAVFREAVRKNPEDPAPHFHLGIILGKQARYREAEEAFSSIRLNPNERILLQPWSCVGKARIVCSKPKKLS